MSFEHLIPQFRRLDPPDGARFVAWVTAADETKTNGIEKFTEHDCEVLMVPIAPEVRMDRSAFSLTAILEQQNWPANFDLLMLDSPTASVIQSLDAARFHPALIAMRDQCEPIKRRQDYELLSSRGYRFAGVIEEQSIWRAASSAPLLGEIPILPVAREIGDLKRTGTGKVSLDSPAVAPHEVYAVSNRAELQLAGWAFGDLDQPVPGSILFRVRHEQTEVEEYVAGQRVNRPDVAQYFQREQLLPSGFQVDLSPSCRRWGTHAVNVIQISSTGLYESPTLFRFALAAQSYETSARAGLANRYLRGSGIEIGALQRPTPLPPSCRVRYIDRMPLDQLLEHYPELSSLPVQAPDLIDDGETLEHLADASQDFIVANHFLEHCENPVQSIKNLLRVLKTDGILFMAIPDKRHTFDLRRPVTRYELLKETGRVGHRPDREALFLEWAQAVSQIGGAEASARARELLAQDYSIHFNVWTPLALLEFLQCAQKDFDLPMEISSVVCSENETIVIIERLGAEARSLEREHAQKDILYHNTIATQYDTVVVSPRRIVNDAIFSACAKQILPGRVMLDLGCGTGHATLRFGRMFQSIVAVDHSSAMQNEAKRNFELAGIRNVETVNEDVLTFLRKRAKCSANAIFCIGFLHHLTEDDIAVVISEAARILEPGAILLISEPRRVDANSVPLEIADWNSRSIAAGLNYSHPIQVVPEEAPIDDETVLAMIRENGMVVDHKYCHWEIFPQTIPVSKEETGRILDLHSRYGSKGNCVTVIAHKNS
jgi:ubiquinone/menaquinone biosynthesis C-methylase UbiE